VAAVADAQRPVSDGIVVVRRRRRRRCHCVWVPTKNDSVWCRRHGVFNERAEASKRLVVVVGCGVVVVVAGDGHETHGALGPLKPYLLIHVSLAAAVVVASILFAASFSSAAGTTSAATFAAAFVSQASAPGELGQTESFHHRLCCGC
jgi:hypothetical protein